MDFLNLFHFPTDVCIYKKSPDIFLYTPLEKKQQKQKHKTYITKKILFINKRGVFMDEKLKPTEMNVIKRCIEKYKRLDISIDNLKATLMRDFNVNSIKYGHVASSYIRGFLLVCEDRGIGKFDNQNMKLIINPDNIELLEFLEENQSKWKKESDEHNSKELQDIDKKLETYKGDVI